MVIAPAPQVVVAFSGEATISPLVVVPGRTSVRVALVKSEVEVFCNVMVKVDLPSACTVVG